MSDNRQHAGAESGHEPPIRESWIGRHGPYVLLLVFLHYCTQLAIGLFDERFDFHVVLPLVKNSIVVLMVAAGVGVVGRVVVQVLRRASWTAILRDVLGQPIWWITWYPRSLRDPASVWDELPSALKVMRTAIWLELLLLPAGIVLAVFVIPTFQAVYASIGAAFPLVIGTYALAVTIGGYVFPLIAAAALVQGWRWHARHGLPRLVYFSALFSVSQDFWRDSDARRLLRH